jgi:hypothetical protein
MALVMVLMLATALPTLAGFTWCMTDPNIKLPDGGVFHLQVGVAEANRDAGFTLTVWAPAGSTVVGNSNKVNMTIVLEEGPAGQVSAEADAAFDVLLAAKYHGNDLGSSVGSGIWDY